MSVPVEAQSLSALTNLLSNPPQYPRNPTHEVRESLVLYIVRVPGSKDVFLTPLKPPTKASISLEAIQSSLYYLHVNSEEDEELKRLIDEQRRSEEDEQKNPPIHRKPLPTAPHANYPPSERPVPPPKSYPSYQPGLDGSADASQNERYVARGSHLRFGSESEAQDPYIHKKPSSPRRLQRSEPNDTYQYSTGSVDSLGVVSEHPPPYLRQPKSGFGRASPNSEQFSYSENLTYSGIYSSQDSAQKSYSELRDEPYTERQHQPQMITLIRRDPVSGSQWNVGNISLRDPDISSAPLGPVSIELTTPGYIRFASMPGVPRSGTGLSDADSIKEALASGRLAGMAPVEGNNTHHSFSRMAEYQRQPVNNRPFRLHRRTDSSESTNKPPSPVKQLRQIYSFMSPWQGLCTFSNGIDGRSLKCRHTLSSSTFTEDDTTANVAELRFNLPWSISTSTGDKTQASDTLPISQLVGPRPGKETIKRGLRHFRNLSRDLRERKSSSDEEQVLQTIVPQHTTESDSDRLSLRLGREKAGGGFKGTSAKLGKLIIEDEGLKMCDLVVAACMGVWWQHYEGRGD